MVEDITDSCLTSANSVKLLTLYLSFDSFDSLLFLQLRVIKKAIQKANIVRKTTLNIMIACSLLSYCSGEHINNESSFSNS